VSSDSSEGNCIIIAPNVLKINNPVQEHKRDITLKRNPSMRDNKV
jgi:hypothetical protein